MWSIESARFVPRRLFTEPCQDLTVRITNRDPGAKVGTGRIGGDPSEVLTDVDESRVSVVDAHGCGSG